MTTLDLSNVPESQWAEKIGGALSAIHPYIPSRDYVETIAEELDWPSDLIQSAHQSGHLTLSGHPALDVQTVKSFMARYEHKSKI